jgi:hypothetical protein
LLVDFVDVFYQSTFCPCSRIIFLHVDQEKRTSEGKPKIGSNEETNQLFVDGSKNTKQATI